MRRAQELSGRLSELRLRIERACLACGRDPAAVTLIAVSKTWPASDVAILRDLGVADFGENRLEELASKAAAVAGVRWHFLGQVQSNKARRVAGLAQVVHAVDRARIVPGLSQGAVAAGRALDVFIQVSLAEMAPDDPAGRGGVAPAGVAALADTISGQPRLHLAGVMTLPPSSAEPAAAFTRIASISRQLQRAHPGADALSAGMSRDFEAAIHAGATHIRIGSALFSERAAVR